MMDDEIYDYDSEEGERADREIEAIEKDEFFERQVDDGIERKTTEKTDEFMRSNLREEIVRMKMMNESLRKVYEILGLPKC